jgi:hypothetical protein
MAGAAAPRTLDDLRADWDAPFTAAPADGAASAARGTLTRDLAAAILAADLHDPARGGRTRVGDLFIYNAGWSRERAAAADAAAAAGTPEWVAALGTHEHATLTGDGGAAIRDQWCLCGGQPPAADWIRYEHWTARGREAHGFVHRGCRRLIQAG